MMDKYQVNQKDEADAAVVPPYLDEKLSIEERQADFAKVLEKRDNPIAAEEFDPATHDPLAGLPERAFKPLERQEPPKRLPTMGLLPDKIRESQMVGMYLSKQELYLLIAHLSNRITDLEEKIALTTPNKEK